MSTRTGIHVEETLRQVEDDAPLAEIQRNAERLHEGNKVFPGIRSSEHEQAWTRGVFHRDNLTQTGSIKALGQDPDQIIEIHLPLRQRSPFAGTDTDFAGPESLRTADVADPREPDYRPTLVDADGLQDASHAVSTDGTDLGVPDLEETIRSGGQRLYDDLATPAERPEDPADDHIGRLARPPSGAGRGGARRRARLRNGWSRATHPAAEASPVASVVTLVRSGVRSVR